MLEGSEGLGSPDWSKYQGGAAYEYLVQYSVGLLQSSWQHVHFFFHLALLERTLCWRCKSCHSVPGPEVRLLPSVEPEPTAESHWENSAGTTMIAFLLGSVSCLDLLNINFVIQTFIASHYFSGTSERIWVLFLFIYFKIPMDYSSDNFKKNYFTVYDFMIN